MSVEPDWEAIRRAYEDHSISSKVTALKYGLTAQRLYNAAVNRNWLRRPPLIGPRTTRSAVSDVGEENAQPVAKPPAKRQAKLTPIATRRAIVTRLSNAIETKLRLLERRLAREIAKPDDAQSVTAADFERDTRSIGLLIKNLEQVTEHDNDQQLGKRLSGAAAKSSTLAATALADEADRLRRELGERLRRLAQSAE